MKSSDPKRTAAVVQANYRRRKRVADAGGRTLNILITPEATQALNALTDSHGETITACIERLLIEAAHKENLS